MEKRRAASIGRQAATLAALEERLRFVEGRIDRRHLGVMLQLPEVRVAAHEERFNSAEKRRQAWRKAIREFFEATDGMDDDATSQPFSCQRRCRPIHLTAPAATDLSSLT
jgi:hypothetical protein